MQDTVFIKQLELQTLIGVYDFEREAPQRVIVDLEIATDLTAAAVSDDVNDTIDYGKMVETIEKVAAQNEARLLEHFGQSICQALFENFEISQLTLTISKPDIIKNAQDVGIVLRRKRSN